MNKRMEKGIMKILSKVKMFCGLKVLKVWMQRKDATLRTTKWV